MNRPLPPRPDLIRVPSGAFGWLEARLLHDGWLRRCGPVASGTLLHLALAADRAGASFYGREKMALSLGVDRAAIDAALQRLLTLELAAHRPWRPGHPDGVWQLLSPPASPPRASSRGPASIAQILARLDLRR